ncbi:tetratricopeptide repeat protein, partial [Micromonospora coxensis]|uniref:tetratricopeptide repeat protein n=1 Tax=Micromonospora coxensis TaxID=356852 RepID=UPI003446E6DE
MEEFSLLLRRLHVRAGKRPYRELEKWAQGEYAKGRREVRLTKQGISEALNGKLPTKAFVKSFLEACGVPDEHRPAWLQAWERVAEHHHVLNPPAPHQRGRALAEERDARVRAEQELAEERARRQRIEQDLAGLYGDALAALDIIDQSSRRLGDAGLYTAARDQFAALLPVLERVLGVEHLDTLSTRYQLAVWAGEAGDVVAARDQLAALLPVRERILGPEHPDTLSTR